MRGPPKHLKRLNAPSSWLLAKKTGKYAPRPLPGPHKLRECIPLVIVLRNKLKYAMNGNEAKKIVGQRNIKVDSRVRTDHKYPLGFMDVVEIEKTGDIFRVLYDVKGRFLFNRIDEEEAKYKLCRVRKIWVGKKGIPYVGTHDGHTIRYPHPDIKEHDTVKYDFESGEIVDYVKFCVGCMAMVIRGVNIGRIGNVVGVDKHPGGFDIVKIKDAKDNTFATRMSNVFVIGKDTPLVKLPKGEGIRLSLTEDYEQRLMKKTENSDVLLH